MRSVKKLRSFRRRSKRLDVFSLWKNGSGLWANIEANVVNGFSVGNRERYDHDRHKVGRNFWPSIDPSLVNNLLLNKGGKKTARELFRGGNLVKFHLIWFNFTLSKNPSTLLLDLILVYPPLFLLEIRFSWFFKLVFNRNTERYVLTPRR